MSAAEVVKKFKMTFGNLKRIKKKTYEQNNSGLCNVI